MTGSRSEKDWATQAADLLTERAEQVRSSGEPACLGRIELSFEDLQVVTNEKQGRRAHSMVEQAIAQIAVYSPTEQASPTINQDRCIYLIRLSDSTQPEPLLQKFPEAQVLPKLRLPKRNANASCDSKTLYVGSSFATGQRKHTLRARLRDHLVRSSAGTYGLSLAAWTGELKGGIEVEAWQFPRGTARQVVLDIEDWLSADRQPIFGRRGIFN